MEYIADQNLDRDKSAWESKASTWDEKKAVQKGFWLQNTLFGRRKHAELKQVFWHIIRAQTS